MDDDDLVLLHCLPMYVYTYVCRRMAIDTLLYYYSTATESLYEYIIYK